MAKHGSILLVMLTLAIADLLNACFLFPRFDISNYVEGFNAEGHVIFSPETCLPVGGIAPELIVKYGASKWPFPPPSSPYSIHSRCSAEDVVYVSAKIYRNSETIFCQDWPARSAKLGNDSGSFLGKMPKTGKYHGRDWYITGQNDNETGEMTCKVECRILSWTC